MWTLSIQLSKKKTSDWRTATAGFFRHQTLTGCIPPTVTAANTSATSTAPILRPELPTASVDYIGDRDLRLILEDNTLRKLILAVITVIMCSGVSLAQDSSGSKGWGYLFGGVGARADDGAVPLLHVGAGGEGLLYKGLGVGAEIGYVAPLEDGSNGSGLFSTNVAYHFRRSEKVSPFVTGGYSLAFRGFASHGGNFGGGVQYWASDRVGLRFEFRDHIFSSDSPHTVSFRFGVSFR